ncbi:MAG: bifunctional diaminohydroxyphosphoribosylaminopyrimidine deaminase/5-amino-6-(5-phosphoribosylamino)uracil reductase RibD [Pseudomonadota bacterium]
MADRARDLRWLDLALALGRRGLGRVWPNPAVGCVIVQTGLSQDRIVGRGWTQPGGRPHAEAMALAQAGDRARGATAYVSLEPCAHHGRTPPCADALAKAGIARLVSTIVDPDPRVAGRGFQRLAEAGVPVQIGQRVVEAEALNAGFLNRLRGGRPFVTLKLATTVDGRIATSQGESRWISGSPARRFAHLLRVRHDAVLVGAGTARADDPMLDVRDLGLAAASPVRVLADGGLRTPVSARLVRSAARQPLWILHRDDAPPERAAMLAEAGATLIRCAADAEGRLDLADAMSAAAERGITRLLCEGGGRMAAALLKAHMVDRLVTVTAGRVIGADGIPGMGAIGLTRLADAPQFRLITQRRIGADLMADWALEDRHPGETADRAAEAS